MPTSTQTYRVTRRAAVRSEPRQNARQVGWVGVGQLVEGRADAGWVEWVIEGEITGYIKVGALQEIPAG